MWGAFLQVFLIVNVFAIGALTVLAWQHFHNHIRTKPEPEPEPVPLIQVPEAMKNRVLHESEAAFKTALEHSSVALHQELKNTGDRLSQLLGKLGNEVVGNEVERYRINLVELRKQAENATAAAQAEIAGHQAQLKAEMEKYQTQMRTTLEQQMTEEKQRMLQQLDTRLGDAVASFLTETLQHNVDLGAQTAYLTAMLDEHKDELIKELGDAA